MGAQAVHVCGRYARCVLARRRTPLALHLLILDTDPDDLIFPRAATRVGPKYQATVPAAPGVADRPTCAHQSDTNGFRAHETVQTSRKEGMMGRSRCSASSMKCHQPKVCEILSTKGSLRLHMFVLQSKHVSLYLGRKIEKTTANETFSGEAETAADKERQAEMQR